MKKTLTIVLSVLIIFTCVNYTEAKVIYDTGKPNITITSPASVTSKRNTELKWTWTALNSTPAVDIYLISKNKKYAFTKSYPNSGNFSWATGYANSEWKNKIDNGSYQIAVCASGTKKIDLSCGIFAVEIYGDTPTLKIVTPKKGKSFKGGSNMEVSFTGAKIGESYDIFLWYPAKVSPIETKLGNMIADVNGLESVTFTIPEDQNKGSYTLGIIQTTNNGTCLNVCAMAESKSIKIK